jgi:hypothetical protein
VYKFKDEKQLICMIIFYSILVFVSYIFLRSLSYNVDVKLTKIERKTIKIFSLILVSINDLTRNEDKKCQIWQDHFSDHFSRNPSINDLTRTEDKKW